MSQPLNRKIFISYSRKDEAFTRQLATELSKVGVTVWLDVKDIPAGMKWSSAIEEGLKQCDLMIVIISPDSMHSNNVEDEWQYFMDEKKPVIPVLHRHTDDVHFQLRRVQYIDFYSQPFDIAFEKLIDELQMSGLRVGDFSNSKQLSAPVNHSGTNWTKWGVISAAVVGLLTVLVTAAQPFIANMLSTTEVTQQVSTPDIPSSETTNHISSSNITPTRPMVVDGSDVADFNVVWNASSLNIIINSRTDFNNIRFTTIDTNGREVEQYITVLWNELGLINGIVDERGACLRLVESDIHPVLPLTCTGDLLIERALTAPDMFWNDQTRNQLRNLIVRRGDKQLAICSAAAQPCEVMQADQ